MPLEGQLAPKIWHPRATAVHVTSTKAVFPKPACYCGTCVEPSGCGNRRSGQLYVCDARGWRAPVCRPEAAGGATSRSAAGVEAALAGILVRCCYSFPRLRDPRMIWVTV